MLAAKSPFMMHVRLKTFINYEHFKKIITRTLEMVKIFAHVEHVKEQNLAGFPLQFHL